MTNWVGLDKDAISWIEKEPVEVSMIRCGPSIAFKSDPYPVRFPFESVGTSITSSLSISVNSITQQALSGGIESVGTDLSGSTLSIVVNEITQQPLSGGVESVDTVINGTLIIESNVIAQESLSGGVESVDTAISISLGIIVQ